MASMTNATTWWQPTAGTTWQISLLNVVQPSNLPNVTAVDADLFDNNATWPAVKAAGYKTICYFSAGSYEDWRSDKDLFQKSDIGASLEGWKGENWLDTRSANVRTIMSKRIDTAAQAHCDAIDPDNMDVYSNGGGGFQLTQDDAVDYITFLADEAHARGMAVGLKNALEIIPRVLDKVDFQVNEQCLQNDECSQVQPFVAADKPVFEIEYRSDDQPSAETMKEICTAPSRNGFSTVVKHMELTTWGYACTTRLDSSNSTASADQPLWTTLEATNSSAGATTNSSGAPEGNGAGIRAVPGMLMLGLGVVAALWQIV